MYEQEIENLMAERVSGRHYNKKQMVSIKYLESL